MKRVTNKTRPRSATCDFIPIPNKPGRAYREHVTHDGIECRYGTPVVYGPSRWELAPAKRGRSHA